MSGAIGSQEGLSPAATGRIRARPVEEHDVVPTSRRAKVLAVLLLVAAATTFLGLGIWQLERRSWKLDLMARIEARVHAEPMPVPASDDWPRMAPADTEYRHVVATGRFLLDRSVRVMAVTERGTGFWLVTPLRTQAGEMILVNRGFVPADFGFERGEVPAVVTGLIRLTEPGGAFLRANDPQAGRWYSRDVGAIATSWNLGPVAPFFIDADTSANRPGAPVGGLTVVSFRNQHLVYAATWLALALLSAAGIVVVMRDRQR